MPAKSEPQRRLMAMARAYKRGEMKGKKVSKKVKELAASMSDKELTEFMHKKAQLKAAGTVGWNLRKMLDALGKTRIGMDSEGVLKSLGFRSGVSADQITESLSKRFRHKTGDPTMTAKAVFADPEVRKQILSSGMVYKPGVDKGIKDLENLEGLISKYVKTKNVEIPPGPPKIIQERRAAMTKKSQATERDPVLDRLFPATAAVGGAGTALGAYDLHRYGRTVSNAQNSLERARKWLMPTGTPVPSIDPTLGYEVPLSLRQADIAVDAYNKAMQEVAHQRILGARSGNIYKNMVKGDTLVGQWQANPSKLDALRNLRRNLRIAEQDPSEYLHHMQMFTDRKVGVPELRGHLIAQSLADKINTGFLPNNPDLRNLLLMAEREGELDKVLRQIKGSPDSYGFISRQHASDFADRLNHILRTEGKPVADVLNFLGGQQALPPQAVSYLTGGSPDSLVDRLKYLRENPQALGIRDPEYAEALDKQIREFILGGKKWMTKDRHVGAAMDMVGDKAKVIGRARTYLENLRRVSNKGKLGMAAVAVPALAYAASSLLGGDKPTTTKTAQALQEDWRERLKEKVRDALPFMAAAPVGIAGAMNASPSREIAVTYGTMDRKYGGPNITAGHKNPAKAIKEILADKEISPWYARFFDVGEDVVRGEGGVLNRPHVNQNVLIDTGFGALNRPGPGEAWAPRYTSQYEKLNPSSVMSYQTDLAPSSLRHAGATTLVDPNVYSGRREILGYGPNVEEFVNQMKRTQPKAMKKVKLRHLGDSLGPAIQSSAIANAAIDRDRGEIMRELIQEYSEKNPELAKRLADIGDNKLVVVSGSSRGDYVAQRAARLAEKLRERGMDDVRIVAQLGDALDDPITERLLAESPEVIRTGRMPNKLYTGLQSVADLHSGSSGASAAAEASMLRSPLSMPEDWGAWPGIKPKPGTPAGEVYRHAVDLGMNDLQKMHGLAPGAVDLALQRAAEKDLGEDLFSYTGRMVSGDLSNLSPEDALGIKQVRAALGEDPKALKSFSEKLTNLLASGDLKGFGDSLAPTADWNEGIVQYLRKMKGTADWNPDKIADLLGDPKALAELKDQAYRRSKDELAKILASRKALNRAVYGRAAKNYLKSSAKGVAGILAALGLTGYGAHRLLNKDKAPT